ncbi:MAG: PEP-CTERM sorting domain-containing protein [Planctomycetota bacterium]
MSGSTTFENNTIAGLGVDIGSDSYVWELGNTAGDTITLIVVPEPSSLALGFICFSGLIVRRRRRREFSCS